MNGEKSHELERGCGNLMSHPGLEQAHVIGNRQGNWAQK